MSVNELKNEEKSSTNSAAFRRNGKNRLILSICILAIGGYLWKVRQPVYKSELALIYHNSDKRTFGEVTQKLDRLAQRHSWDILADELHISTRDAEKISRIIPKDEAGAPLYAPANPKEYAPIYVTVIATERSVYKKLESSLVNYFNICSPSTTVGKTREVIDDRARVKYLEHDLALLDSIIEHYSSLTRKINMLSDTSILALNQLFSYKNSLEEQILRQNRRLAEISDNVEVLHGFLPAQLPQDNRPMIIILTVATIAITWLFPKKVVSRQINYGKNGIKKSVKIARELLKTNDSVVDSYQR